MFLYFAKFHNYMNNTKYIILSLVSLVIFFYTGCNGCDNKAVKNIDATAQIYRFDSLFYSIDKPANLTRSLSQIKSKDPDFYNLYITKLFSMDKEGERFEEVVFSHINSSQNQEIRKRVEIEFGDFKQVQGDLDLLSKYYKLCYSKRKFPKIYTCYSGFAGFMAWLYNDSCLLVDLDMYLGDDFEAYPQFYPQFKFTYYDKDYLAQNVGKELIRTEFMALEKEKPKHMLALMLIEGAKIYELSKLMPCREVAKLFEYTPEQWEWAKREEQNIWKYMIKENLLYESNYKEYRPLVGEAPASLRTGVAQGAPPRIAIFAGYQIVKKFIEESDVADTYEMFGKYSPEDILKEAKYKP